MLQGKFFVAVLNLYFLGYFGKYLLLFPLSQDQEAGPRAVAITPFRGRKSCQMLIFWSEFQADDIQMTSHKS